MKFMLMMNAPRGTGDWQVNQWTQADLEAHIGFMHELNRGLTKTGELASAEGLAPPDQAKLVRMSKDGVPAVTDGPFPESKEFLAGYWILDVERPERAYEIAGKISAAPGPGGKPLLMAVEVRQVMGPPPTDA